LNKVPQKQFKLAVQLFHFLSKHIIFQKFHRKFTSSPIYFRKTTASGPLLDSKPGEEKIEKTPENWKGFPSTTPPIEGRPELEAERMNANKLNLPLPDMASGSNERMNMIPAVPIATGAVKSEIGGSRVNVMNGMNNLDLNHNMGLAGVSDADRQQRQNYFISSLHEISNLLKQTIENKGLPQAQAQAQSQSQQLSAHGEGQEKAEKARHLGEEQDHSDKEDIIPSLESKNILNLSPSQISEIMQLSELQTNMAQINNLNQIQQFSPHDVHQVPPASGQHVFHPIPPQIHQYLFHIQISLISSFFICLLCCYFGIYCSCGFIWCFFWFCFSFLF
jgi:hypothetical protein